MIIASYGDIASAMAFAIEKHGDQKYGNQPYWHHLLDTMNLALDHGLSTEIAVACLLHDVLDDTRTHYSEVLERFGLRVVTLVWGVTDEMGRNRRERHSKTLVKIENDVRSDLQHDVVNIKLCDRIANVKQGGMFKIKMYKQEHKAFVEGYLKFGGDTELWDMLNQLME